MRSFLFSLGLLALASASDVHELKKDTFKDFIQENDLVLAECKFNAHSILPQKIVSFELITSQFSHHGAAIAKLSPPSTKKLPQH